MDIASMTTKDLVRDIKRVLNSQASFKRMLEPLQEREKELRDALLRSMTADGAKTVELDGIEVQRKTRKVATIVDEHALVDHLGRAGILEDYTRLDVTAAKRDGAKHGWPGVEVTSREELAVVEREVAK